MRLAALTLLALAACSKSTPSSPEVQGTLTVKGDAVTITRCHPKRGLDGVYVILETTKGALRFENKEMYWNGDDREGFMRGAKLDCGKVDRSWGGGTRRDGTAYFRGMLDFECNDGPNEIAGKLTLDCGDITAEERAKLDEQRTKLQEDQKKWQGGAGDPGAGSATAGSGSGSAAGSGAN